MAIFKYFILLGLLIPGMSTACPENMTSKYFKKILYETEDKTNGELKNVQIGWTKIKLLQHLTGLGIERAELVPVNEFYATADCPEELDRIAYSGAIRLNSGNQAKIAQITIKDGRVVKVEPLANFNLRILEGDSLKSATSELKKLLVSGLAKSVAPELSCGNRCIIGVKELGQIDDDFAFKYIPKDNRGRVTVYLDAGKVVRVTYLRQRLKGDGVF